MRFVSRIISDAASLVIAIVLVVLILAYAGTTPDQRYECETERGNVVQTAVCMTQAAL